MILWRNIFMPAGYTLDPYCARPSKPHSDAKYLEKGLNGGRGVPKHLEFTFIYCFRQ